MADAEAEQERSPAVEINQTIEELTTRLQQLQQAVVQDAAGRPVPASSEYCQEFCKTLLEYAGRWKVEEEPLPLVQVYMVALLSYAQASESLSLQCDNVPVVVERLSLSFVELLLSLKDIPDGTWQQFKQCVQFADNKLAEKGLAQLSPLTTLSQYDGVWTSSVLQALLSNQSLQNDQVEQFLQREGPVLLQMRVKQLMKEQQLLKAALLAKTCAEAHNLQGGASFRQMYLVCLCASLEQNQLMDQLAKEDCREVLDMICNLESDGDDRAAFSVCSAFLTRQLLQGDTYCAWELTLFWSKLLKRLEPSQQDFLSRCRQLSLISKTVYHILFLMKVIQSEMDDLGVPVCIEMCIRALRMETDDGSMKATVCKTISCLLPNDLEVKRACQLTEFLLEPTVDSYYAVESLYNEPDQKLEEESMPIPNSLRCDLLLVFKTQWPFDPEFWDWKTLKRHCLALMGEEASIVSSIDSLNDTESPGEDEDFESLKEFNDIPSHLLEGTYELNDVADRRQKNREMKKLREKGFISARFRNWQAYMQYCVLCDKEFLGHRIVRHAQIHQSGGMYTCPICAQTFSSKDTFIPHVTSHVKQSCKERLTAMKTRQKLCTSRTAGPIVTALTLSAQTQDGLHEYRDSISQKRVSILSVQDTPAQVSQGNICPVEMCRRSFKFLKNLIAHVKTHGEDEEAKTFLEMQSKKVVCQYCQRHFVSVNHLNDHLQAHCGVKPYICIHLNCKASFLTYNELIMHKKRHPFFKARCMFPNCGKVFSEAFRLYDHEAQHYKTFTCKFVDCGNVFHSQQQLDLHQQKHVAEEESSPVLQPSLIKQSGSSTKEQMLRESSLSSKEGGSQSTWYSDTALNVDPASHPKSNDDLLKSPQEPLQSVTELGATLNPPSMNFLNSHAQRLSSSVIQSISHMPEVNGLQDDSAGPSFDYMQPTLQNQPAPLFETSVDNVLQSHPQMIPNNVALGNQNVCNIPMVVHQTTQSCTNREPSTASQASILTEPQPLPRTVKHQQLAGTKPENFASSSSISSPILGQRERFHCAVETCIRHYSSQRSVTKHMKAVHPDFYEQWKVARTKIKVSYAPAPGTPHLSSASLLQDHQVSQKPVNTVQRQNIFHLPPYSNIVASSNFYSQDLRPSSAHGSDLMSDVLNPIVLEQLGSEDNAKCAQAQDLDDQNWQSVAGAQQNLKCTSSITYQSTLQIAPRGSSAYVALPPTNPSCSMIGGDVSRLARYSQSPLVDNKNQQFLHPHVNDANEMQQGEAFSPYTVQTQSSLASVSKSTEEAQTIQNHLQPNCTPAESQKNVNNHYPNGPHMPENSGKPVRKSRRSKWPAIIRDGKFVCCRCFRQFDNPRSLGGHLSKRAICKPYAESELNADLPRSFLDLLHSEHTDNTPQSHMSYNTTAATVYQDKQHVSDTTASSARTKVYSAPNCSHDDLPAFGKDEASDAFPHTMTESNISDLFEPLPSTYTLFQNHCPPFGNLLGGSVIQHTENLQLKHEDNPYSTHYPQPHIDTFAGNKFSDPLLSQILKENPLSAIPDSSNPIHSAAGQYSRTATQMSNIEPPLLTQTLLHDFKPSPPASSSFTEAEQKVTEQDIKKRLREQILAGDFQRRNGGFHPGTIDLRASSNALGPSSASLDNLSLHGRVRSPKNDSPSDWKIIQEKCSILPGTSAEVEQLLNTPSFMHFREGATQQKEIPSPMFTVEHEFDSEPTQLPASQQESMSEIQCAFERLDLRERAVHMTASQGSVSNIQKEPVKIKPRKSVPYPLAKPYPCERESCTFRAMTADTLWRHLSKAHCYTLEMVNAVKRRLGLYAPFKCQKCPKAFTRNSNLRVHYQSAHKLSIEEITDLDNMRRMAKAAESVSLFNHTVDTNQIIAPTSSHSTTDENTHSYVPGEVKQDCIPELPCPNERSQEKNRSTVIHSLQTDRSHNQPRPQAALAHTSSSAAHWSHLHQGNLHKTFPVCAQTGIYIHQDAVPLNYDPSAPQMMNPPESLLEQPVCNTPVAIQQGVDVAKKMKKKRPKSDDSNSQYRPYCCVHQGCVAAFTIQHNLILHYRAVHQSALSALEVNREQDQGEGPCETMEEDEEETEADYPHISEFRCQVKDCCCVFQSVPNLFQHYLQLHKFTLEKVGNLLSLVKLGKFTCGHQGCTDSFTIIWMYIKHIGEMHKNIKLCKTEPFNVSFKCEFEGCDRSYATKSNLLRHVMKKHQEVYEPKLNNQHIKEDVKQNSKTLHYPIPKPSNGKENIESNKKLLTGTSNTKRSNKSTVNHWAKYGKPSLKSKVEASAMCTKRFDLQYPCMIKGCESVMKSERHIMKHYIGHGLSAKYLEQQRSCFIFCKKFPRQRHHSIRTDDSKSDNTSDLSDSEPASEAASVGRAENDSLVPILHRRATAINPIVLIHKISSEGTNGTVLLKRKRGRPRKFMDKIEKPKKIRLPQAAAVTNESDAVHAVEGGMLRPAGAHQEGRAPPAPLASFKPMGFEVSFLKFLEQSNKSESSLMGSVVHGDAWSSPSILGTKDSYIWFSNPCNLKSLGKVRISLDLVSSRVSKLMVKQLQDMQPAVCLTKCDELPLCLF